MIVGKGSKAHIVYRALYENSTRRHFLGEVVEAEGALCRIEGYMFILDHKTDSYLRRPDLRTTIIDLADSGYVVSVIPTTTDIEKVSYKYLPEIGQVATDGGDFVLNIDEFTARS